MIAHPLVLRTTRVALACGVFVAACLAVGSGTAQADYKAQRGDILDITVFGSPDMSRHTTVDIDGRIGLPLIGAVTVAGLSVAEIHDTLVRRLSEGKLVKTPEVTIEVVDYRPVYVKGDVFNGGAFPFRPGMTIRQLLALAGGSGQRITGGPAATPASELADLRGEYTALWTELASRQAHLDRLRAELDDKAAVDFTPFAGRQLRPETLAKIKSLEKQQLDAIRTGSEKSVDHLKAMAGFAADQLSTLEEQRKEVEESVKLQSDEVDKVKGLFLKGVVTSTRLTDEQRALSAAKTQLLSNIAQAGDVRRLRADFDDKIRESGDSQQLQSLKDYQQTLVDVDKTRARLVAAGQKLIAAKDNISQPQAGLAETTTYTIFRRADDGPAQLTASEDTEVSPGDVIEIKSTESLVPSAASSSQNGTQGRADTVVGN